MSLRENGRYQVTCKGGEVNSSFFHYGTWSWGNEKNIIAYKKEVLSPPYIQPQEPERELRCPFGCDGTVQISRFKACGHYYWYCAQSGCRGRDEKKKEDAIKHLHQAYNKLNK